MQLTRIEKENEEYFMHLCPEDLLTDDRLLKLGVIDDEEEPVSVCVTGVSKNLANIMWLYTDPEKRERGAGTFLLDELLRLGEESGLEGIIVSYSSQDEDMDDFLSERGFLVGSDEKFYRVPISSIVYSREMDMILERRGEDRHTFTLTDPRGQKYLTDLITTHKLNVRMFEGIKAEYCVIYEDPESKQISAIFVSRINEDDLYVNYLISDRTVQGLCEVIGHLQEILLSEGITKGDLIFADRGGKAVPLVEKIFDLDYLDELIEKGHMQAVMLFDRSQDTYNI